MTQREPARTRRRRSSSALLDPTLIATGELRKSAETRRRIMEAAVHCLAVFGYAGTNAVTVADQAGLTRPAMLYHFRTRIALIEATINFVVRERIAAFEAAVASANAAEDSLVAIVDLAWAQNATPLYRAYCELANAAQTDPDLAAVFGPAMVAYDRARRHSAMQLFTDEQKAMDGFHLRRDVVRFLLDGMAGHGSTLENGQERIAAMLGFLRVLTSAPEASALIQKALQAAPAVKRRRARPAT